MKNLILVALILAPLLASARALKNEKQRYPISWASRCHPVDPRLPDCE